MSKKLEIKVLLGTIDKVTAPFKRIRESSGGVSQAVKIAQETVKQLEKQTSQIDGYRKLRRNLADTSTQMKRAKQNVTTLAAELAKKGNQDQKLIRDLEKAKAVRQKLITTQRKQWFRQKRENEALQAAGINTRQLALHQKTLATSLDKANIALEMQKQRLAQVSHQQKQMALAKQSYDKTMGFRNQLAGTGAVMLGTGMAAGYAGSRFLQPGLEFGKSQSRVQALTRLNANDPQLKALREQARHLGATTSFTSSDVSSGQAFLAMADFTPEAIKAAMPAMLDLAKAGDLDLGQSADIASNILSAFKMPAEQMTKLADVMALAMTTSNVDLQMLGQTMKYVAPIASSVGMTLEETAAAAGLLGNIGIQSSQAGTVLRSMLNRLAGPSAAASEIMGELGLQTKDANGNLRNIIDVMSDAAKLTEEFGTADRLAIYKELFGEEAAAGINELISQSGAGEFAKYARQITEQHNGVAKAIAKTMADNANGDLEELRSAWQDIGIELFEGNNSAIRQFIKQLTGIVGSIGQWMKVNPELTATIFKGAAAVTGLAIAGGTLALTIAGILGPLAMIKYSATVLGIKTLPSLTDALKWAGLGSMTFAKAQWAAVASSISLKKANAVQAWRSLTVAIGRATMGAMMYAKVNGLMATSQVVAMAGLKGMGKAILTTILAPFKLAWGAITMVGKALGFVLRAALFTPVGLAITAIGVAALTIYKYWQPIKAFFAGFWQGLKEGLAPVAETLGPAFTAFGAALSPLKPIWDGIASVLGTVWNWVKELLKPLEATSEQLDGATNAGKRFGLWLAEIINFFPRVIGQFGEFGANLIGGIINGITGKLGELRDTITGAASSAIGWFKDVLGINSPSRVFARAGDDTMAGLVVGLKRSQQLPLQQVNQLGNQLKAASFVLGVSALPLAADTHSTITEQLQPAAIPAVQDSQRAITEFVIPAALSPVADAQRTITEQLQPAAIPAVQDSQRAITEYVIPAMLSPVPDTQRTITEQLQPAAIPAVQDSQRAITEYVIPAALSPVTDAQRTITEQLIPAKQQHSNSVKSTGQVEFTSSPFAATATAPATTKQAKTVHIDASLHAPITIYTQPGMDEQVIARLVQQQLAQRDREQQAKQRAALRDLE